MRRTGRSTTEASPTLQNSLLYQLHSYRMNGDVPKPELFDEVLMTKHRMVRIYKVWGKRKGKGK